MITKKIKSKKDRLRLSIFRSNKNISAQLIDDEKGHTVISSNTAKEKNGQNTEAAKKVGTDIAKKAMSAKIKKVIFDRGKFQYKGRVKALAEAAREAGLLF